MMWSHNVNIRCGERDLAYNETGLREEMRAVNDKDLHTDASERDLVCALSICWTIIVVVFGILEQDDS